MSLNGCLGSTGRGGWRGVGRKGWQRVGERLAKDWQRVGEGLAKGWQRVGGFPCTLQFRNSLGARLETWVCDSMVRGAVIEGEGVLHAGERTGVSVPGAQRPYGQASGATRFVRQVPTCAQHLRDSTVAVRRGQRDIVRGGNPPEKIHPKYRSLLVTSSGG